MKDLYTEIIEEGYEDTTVGNDIIDTFCSGNFTQGVKELIAIEVSPREFGSYIKEQGEEMAYEFSYDSHFDHDFWISIGESYSTIAKGL